jgi:phosphomannomutase
MKVNPSIFKAYDIRGKYPTEVNEWIAERVGFAAAFSLSPTQKTKLEFLICRDVRVSSTALKEALIRGILKHGSRVVDVGVGTTPYFYYLMHAKRFAAGIMVTASHNPPEFNGFKIRKLENKAVSIGSGLEKIKKMILSSKSLAASLGIGTISYKDFSEEYVGFINAGISIKKMNAVIDASGGCTAYFLPRILERFSEFFYKPLFFEPDGSFSIHPPNPLLNRSQEFIKRELESGKFKFGVIFDGDGDRAVFLDERGSVLKGEYIFGLLAEEILRKKPGAWFVMPVNTSRGVREYLAEKGARIKLVRIGYTFMQEGMKKTKAPLGVELSGHFYFKEFFGDDSALMAFLNLSAFLSKNSKPISQLVKPFERYVSPAELNFEVQEKNKTLSKIKKYYRDGKISLLDGLTIEYRDWWFNVRPSNTESLLRLVLEAKNQTEFDKRLAELKNLIH